MCDKKISKSVLDRLPIYLHYLNSDCFKNKEMVSSVMLAKIIGFGEVLVRKDLAMVCGSGKPKIGYLKNDLIKTIMETLDCLKIRNAIVIGKDTFANSLFLDNSFNEYNIFIKEKFELNENDTFANEKIANRIKNFCKQESISIGIIATDDTHAQTICDLLVSMNIKAIWNLTPTKLKVPTNVKIKEENMAASLASLAANI